MAGIGEDHVWLDDLEDLDTGQGLEASQVQFFTSMYTAACGASAVAAAICSSEEMTFATAAAAAA